MEACFQQLCVLKLGTGGRGGAPSMLAGGDGRWELADPWQALASQGLETRPAREGDAKERHGDAKPGEALGAGQVLPELGLDSGELLLGPGEPPELGLSLGEPSAALERARRSLRRLVSGLEEERSQVLQDNLRLRRDRERCHQRMRALQREGERSATRACTLAQENGALLGDVGRLRRELDQYLQVIADLEDCNGKSYGKISELEEENGTLRGCLGQLRRATAESARKCKGVVRAVTRENRELKALISELGVSYQGLIRDVVVGIEDVVRALRGENARLLHRIRVLEREVAVRVSMSEDGRRLQAAQGKGKVVADKASVVERAVQVTQLPEPPAPGVLGSPLEEAQGPAAGWTGPTPGTEKAGCQAESAVPLPTGTDAGTPGDLGGAAAHSAYPEKEEERLQQPLDRGPARRSLCQGPQDPEATPSEEEEEDPGLRVRRLRHQVLTLQCQLRDQASAGRELQAARDEALRLRDQLQAQVEDLQQKQHEANLAVTPLKAKLASLVQKCRDRNQLLAHLLQELRGRGAADALLSEAVRGMVDDVALAEYAAAFLVPGLPETSHRPDFQPEEAAAVRAQKYLLNPETDSVPPRPARAESQPLAEAAWPAQTAPPASLELPLPPGPTRDPGPYPAVATPTSGLPARRLHGGGEGGVAPPPPPSGGPVAALRAPGPREDPGLPQRAAAQHPQRFPGPSITAGAVNPAGPLARRGRVPDSMNI
ncbi:hypothetical protein HJG60_001850 [Phyllostomus discolor]|uniref:Uncharacterized protein n=1 Tax=Phyllostomus discolor TaxID=89673 RepID=A0A834ETX3_9CHIR|nr:hypothetical protein HJG60_001850 [Phyllostomus discolor]